MHEFFVYVIVFVGILIGLISFSAIIIGVTDLLNNKMAAYANMMHANEYAPVGRSFVIGFGCVSIAVLIIRFAPKLL